MNIQKIFNVGSFYRTTAQHFFYTYELQNNQFVFSSGDFLAEDSMLLAIRSAIDTDPAFFYSLENKKIVSLSHNEAILHLINIQL